MDIKQILAVVSATGPHEEAISVAAALACQEGALVQGVCLFHEPAATVPDSFAVGRLGIEAVLHHRDQTVRALVAPAERAFRAALTSRGLSMGWETGEADQWCDELLWRARLADLIVMVARGDDGAMRRVTERLVVESGAPCMMVPAAAPHVAPAFRRIVVGWNHSREAKRALGDAMFLLTRAEDVALVVVGDEPDRRASAEALQKVLMRHGVDTRLSFTVAGDRSVGQALADEAMAFKADLIVMGAFGHSRATELILGGATRDLATRCPLPILMSH